MAIFLSFAVVAPGQVSPVNREGTDCIIQLSAEFIAVAKFKPCWLKL